MTCSGCSGAIERVLGKTQGQSDRPGLLPAVASASLRTQLTNPFHPPGLAGITSYDVSLDKQEVIVKTAIPYDDILAKIKKTGKEVRGGEVVASA